MKIIFLDFDGVLNSERYVRSCGHFGVIIDPSRMELLKEIVDATDAKIVLSTSWRRHWSPVSEECDETGLLINDIFKKHGLEVFDKTDDKSLGYTNDREGEIERWVKAYPETEAFVVLDDLMLDGTGFLKGHFVRTNNLVGGLDKNDVAKAIEILNA